MKLAFSSNAYMRFSVEETIERIAALGYAGLELLADVPHAWPAGLLDERKQAIRGALEKHGLKIANINGFMMNAVADPRQPYWHPSWIEPDPHYRAIRREHTKRALKLAAELGAPSLQTEPGGPLAPGQSWADAATVFYNELMPCVEVAETEQVLLLIEPEAGLLIETFPSIWSSSNASNRLVVGLNFDIGHAFCVGHDPAEWIPKMAAHQALSPRRHPRQPRTPPHGPGRGASISGHVAGHRRNRL